MIAMIGTSDRLCWLAETCKILLLLLEHQILNKLTRFQNEVQTPLRLRKGLGQRYDSLYARDSIIKRLGETHSR